jgi:hypothetical protein
LLSCAKAAIEAGDRHLREAAEALVRARDEFGATQRELAEAVGRSASWVNRLLTWHRSGFEEESPFGPTTKAGRVSHAKQRAASGGRATGSSGKRQPTKTSDLKVMPITGSPAAASPVLPTSAPRSPAEAKEQLMDAIRHWWPLLDDDDRVEVTKFFFKQTGARVNAAAA